VLVDPPRGEPEVILIGTGSEVSLCVSAYEELTAEGVRARVVSMPCGSSSSGSRSRIAERPPAGDHGARRGRAGVDFRLAAYVGPLVR